MNDKTNGPYKNGVYLDVSEQKKGGITKRLDRTGVTPEGIYGIKLNIGGDGDDVESSGIKGMGLDEKGRYREKWKI